MSLSSKTVLHIVCKDTLFSAAIFVRGESTLDIWNDYVKIWANPHVGHPKTIHADFGPQFRSEEWKEYLRMSNIELHTSVVKIHNALGVGERYHECLRQINRRVKNEHKTMNLEYVLSLATQAMDATAGKDGLSPCLLVFGISPTLPITSRDLPEQRKRMKALQTARSEMVKIIARQRLASALRRNVPSSADRDILFGSDVLLYKERPRHEWVGTYKVMAGDNENVLLNMNGRIVPASVDKVKPYQTSPTSNEQRSSLRRMDSVLDKLINSEVLLVSICKGLAKVQTATGIYTSEMISTPNDVLVTEIIEPDDNRNNSELFHKAEKAEMQGLIERRTWTVVDVK